MGAPSWGCLLPGSEIAGFYSSWSVEAVPPPPNPKPHAAAFLGFPGFVAGGHSPRFTHCWPSRRQDRRRSLDLRAGGPLCPPPLSVCLELTPGGPGGVFSPAALPAATTP